MEAVNARWLYKVVAKQLPPQKMKKAGGPSK
jgi:hypothetical protein